MRTLEDPVLALIARFVVKDFGQLDLPEDDFLQQQLKEISRHIGDAPKDQRQKLAMAWIKEHAERYRKEWQRQAVTDILLNKRCADCPLIHDSSKSPCVIHGKWVALIEEYQAEKISSEEYIKESCLPGKVLSLQEAIKDYPGIKAYYSYDYPFWSQDVPIVTQKEGNAPWVWGNFPYKWEEEVR